MTAAVLKDWEDTKHDPDWTHRAVPGALYMPGPYLIQIKALDLLVEDDSAAPDLAYGQLLLPAGPNGELQGIDFHAGARWRGHDR